MGAPRTRYLPTNAETLLGAADAARILACSPDMVRKLWDRGEIPYVRIGSDRRVKYVDLMAYIDRQTVAPRGLRSISLSPAARSRGAA